MPSVYEQQALVEIREWKNPTPGWFGKATASLGNPLDKAGDLLMETPGLGWVIEKSLSGLVSVANDVAQWTVNPAAIQEKFRNAGHPEVQGRSEIKKLSLEDVDQVAGWLAAKYKGLALVEGAAAGSIGAPGIPPDIIALVTFNLRAIGEYATYYGFDVSTRQEQMFALNVLGFASSSSDSAKGVAMSQLVKIAKDVAGKKTWKDLQKHTIVKMIQQIAKALGIRLTKAKLAQIVPVMGAIVGGGFNVYYTSKVCDAAYFLYRERFLAAKYGADAIAGTAASELSGEYPESYEPVPTDRTPPPGVSES